MDCEQCDLNVIGGGRDRDYGYLGFSHWADDDKKIMSCFDNINTEHPESIDELQSIFSDMIENPRPNYLNLKK